ncbi:hypothetical protein I4F81_000119 [Pyropia yezoensis]|uniref:Uncharacterized protein n=1 Tax=Pyropia yezoensis TaxID=2788 RepID=A0ACC3BJ28_PYRYE|nr:hypothetical protein I4F81_000119 [Neopyropia yezoensis]
MEGRGGGRPVAAAGDHLLYVNCGSDLIKSYDNHTWAADAGFDGGLKWVRTGLAGGPLNGLFHTSRYNPGLLTYTLRVPAASNYRLELVWAETFFTEAARRFMDVFVRVDGVEVEAIVQALDVYGEAQGRVYKLVYPPLDASTYGMPVQDTVQVFLQQSPASADVPATARGDPFLSGVGVYEDTRPTPAPTPTPSPGPTPDPDTGLFPPPNPEAINEALANTKAAGAPDVPVRAIAAAAREAVSQTAARVEASRVAADTAFGVTTPTDEVRAAYATAVDAVTAMRAAAAAFDTTYTTSFTPLTTAYNAAVAFIGGLSPEACSFITGVVKPFGYADEQRLVDNLAEVREAAAAAEAAGSTLATQEAEVTRTAAMAETALENFLEVVKNEAQPSPLPRLML